MKTTEKTAWLLLAPILLGVAVFFLIPFGITLYYSVTFGVTGRFVGWQNYADVLGSSAFRLAAGNTLRFLGLGVPVNMVLSFALALGMRERLAGTGWLRTTQLLPMVMGTAGIVTAAQRLIPAPVWDSPAAFWVLLMLYVWKSFGYNTVLYLAGLNGIPTDYYRMADLEGATSGQKLRYITLPLMVPTFFFVFVISVINCFRSYREAFLLAGEHPHESVYMLQHFLSNNFKNLNYQRLSVAAVCLFALVAVLCALFYRKQREVELT